MLQSFRPRRGQKALVMVAHPDDETIWMGGFILRYPGIDWRIHALCRASDPDRAPKFRRVCRRLGAAGTISDLPDDGSLPAAGEYSLIRDQVLATVRNRRFDLLFTHGANGEYGHPQHKTVHRVVRDLWRAGSLPVRRFLVFHYRKVAYRPGRPLRAAIGPDLTLSLTAAEYEEKMAIMTGIYGFERGGIDAGYCPPVESFRELAADAKSGLNR